MSFELYGTRELIEANGLPPIIEERVRKLEDAVIEGSNDAFDHAKSLVESVCKTIILDKGADVNPNADIKSLLNQVLRLLRLIDPNHPLSDKGSNKLISIVTGLRQTVQGLAEMRNLAGFISHGPDGYMVPLDRIHMRLAAMSADALTYYVLSLHKKLTDPGDRARIYYEDYPEFNDFLDESNPEVEILGAFYRPSEVLFAIDAEHITYREQLIIFNLEKQELSLVGA